MSPVTRSALDWVVLGLLAALIVTNIAALTGLLTGGRLVGLIFYLIILAHALPRGQRDRRPVMVVGLLGLAVHIAEATVFDGSLYPVLLVLNLVFSAGLALAAWVQGRRRRQMAGNC